MKKYKLFYYCTETLHLKPIPAKYYIFILLAGMILGTSAGLTSFYQLKKNQFMFMSAEEKLVIIKEYNKFTEDKLVEKLKELNVKFPYIVLAQSKLETGNFTSKVFRENNNLFGMREAKQRITTAKGTENNHAFYHSWYESVLDYSFYQCRYLSNIQTEEQYFQYLEQSYAEDPTYIIKVKQIVVKEKLKEKFGS